MTTQRTIETYLMDMDGVLVHQERLIPGADQFISRLQETGHRFLVLTNNSIYTPRDLAARLALTGLQVPEEAIWTSALATAHGNPEGRMPEGYGRARLVMACWSPCVNSTKGRRGRREHLARARTTRYVVIVGGRGQARLVRGVSLRSSNALSWSATAGPEIPTRLASSWAAKATPTNSAIPVRFAHSNSAMTPVRGP
jgi:phosphoglycolate phosphatase-like HAD superfamily hydrolase